MAGSAVSEWQKGGIRYSRLRGSVPEYLAPEHVRIFFVGVQHRGGLFRLLTPFAPLQREYVVAVTEEKVVVLWLRRPGVFRACIGGVAYEGSPQQADVRWQAGELAVAGTSYKPINFHHEDAEELARMALVRDVPQH